MSVLVIHSSACVHMDFFIISWYNDRENSPVSGITMSVCYNKPLHRMIDKKATNAQRMEQAGFSANIIRNSRMGDQRFLHE